MFDERAHPKAFLVLIGVAVEHQVYVVLAAEGGIAPIEQLLLEGAKLLLEFLVITDQLLKPVKYSVAFDGGTDSPAPVFEFNVGHGHIRVQYSVNAEVVMLQLEKGPLILRHLINLIVILFLLGKSKRLLVVSDSFFELAFLEVLIASLLTVVHSGDNMPESAKQGIVLLDF